MRWEPFSVLSAFSSLGSCPKSEDEESVCISWASQRVFRLCLSHCPTRNLCLSRPFLIWTTVGLDWSLSVVVWLFPFCLAVFFLLFDSSSTVLMIVSYNTCCLGLTLIPSICLALPLLALPRPKATRVRLTILMDTGTDADTTDLSIENRLGEKTSIAAIRSGCSFGLPIHWFVDQACE
jgi:hypothetical protein